MDLPDQVEFQRTRLDKIELRLAALEGDQARDAGRWNVIFDFCIKIGTVIAGAYLLIKFGLKG